MIDILQNLSTYKSSIYDLLERNQNSESSLIHPTCFNNTKIALILESQTST